MSSGEHGFTGVWIPAELWESQDVTLQEKVMLVQIKSLAKKYPDRGCFMRNDGFADFFGLSKSRVSEIISSLEKKGLITVHFQRRGKQIVERNIYMTQHYHDMTQEKVIAPGNEKTNTSTPSGLASNPFGIDCEPSSGLAIESNTKRVIHKSSKDLSSSDDVAEVFEHWKQVMGKASNAKLTDKRRKCIIARMKDGYHVAEIKRAIDNCSRSPHHMGRNDTGTVYNDLTLICRSGDKLEWFMNDVGAKPPTRGDARRHIEPGKTDYRSDTCGMELAN